jgi:hypothetical protein
MSNVLRGQVWRNTDGFHVRVFGVGSRRDGTEALWVDVCDAGGNVIGGRIPMECTFGHWSSGWTLAKEATP